MCKFYIGYIKIHVSYAVKPQGCQYSNGGNQMQARDLKSIIESENHELKTQFCNVPFTITPDRNIYNIIRNKYKELALEAQTKFAEINEQFEDLDDLINNAPSAFVYCIEKALLELIQDIISVDIYTIDKDAVVNMAFDGVYFDEFTEAFKVIDKKYEKILTDLNDAEYARELRKESRPRWQSATFGGNAINAWSNQLDATAMNITEGIAYSLVNAVGNMMSRSYARSQIKELFNTMSLRQDMVNSVYDSCFNLHLLMLDIVEKNTAIKFDGTVSAADTQKAQAMFNNMMSISLSPEKRDAFIVQIFELDPYEDSFYSKLIDTMGDEDDSIGKFSEFFGVNIFDIKNDILARFVNDNIGETEEDAVKCKGLMEEYAAKIGLSTVQIVQARNIVEERLKYFNDLYCTVDGVLMDSRAEADLAREELPQITAIFETVTKPTDKSDLDYENELIEKRKQIDSFKTKVKDKYLENIDALLSDFDRLFRKEGKFDRSLTREEAGAIRAFEYVKGMRITSFEERDNAVKMLTERLSHLGITEAQAENAYAYLDEVEKNLCVIDGIQFANREEALKATAELNEITAIVNAVPKPDKNSVLPYEKMLDETKAKLESYETDVKNKYIGIIEQYKAKFDTTFRTVGFTVYETRKEAAAQRALNFAKSVIPKGYTEQDLIDARQKVDEFLLTVGITFEEAEQVSELFRQCYLNVNTVDGIAFNSKEEAEAARAELAEITAIMSDVPKPNPDLLLDYEQKLFDVKAKLESYKTPVKDKYIAIIDDYIAKFDTTFKTTGTFSKAETRQQAAQIRALKLVKSIAPTGCTYDDVDKAIKALDDTLPKLGIDKTLATDATDYIKAQEDKLNTVDGVVLPDRENAALAKKELEEIQNIMFKVAPPQNEPLLSYERNLLEIEDKLSQLRTPVKDKYIGIIKKHLVDFDEKFRKVSLIKTAATREEAAKERALKFVKSKTYNTVTDVNNARNELAELLPELGITSEQATEANEYLTNTENKLNGTAPQSKLKGVFGMFKK